MQAKYIGIIIAVFLLGVGGYFLLRGGYQTQTPVPAQKETTVPQERTQPTESSPATQAPLSKIKEITVVATEFNFNPASISLKADEKVKITFQNKGRATHNLTIEGLDIGTKTIGGGQTDVVEFIAPASGTYTFFCSVSGHQAAGMEGSFIVE